MQPFYADNPSKIFRLGDVITGFHSAEVEMDIPHDDATGLQIRVTRPKFFGVMTPCCSIENKVISVAPLVPLRHKFFDNPHLFEDFTRLNSRIEPQNTLPPIAWSNLTPEQRTDLLARGQSYIFIECFVYAPNAVLGTYPLKKGTQAWPEVGHWMLDFKSIFKIDCGQIERNREAPAGIKLLELRIPARSELREKLAYFFGRVPDEDIVS